MYSTTGHAFLKQNTFVMPYPIASSGINAEYGDYLESFSMSEWFLLLALLVMVLLLSELKRKMFASLPGPLGIPWLGPPISPSSFLDTFIRYHERYGRTFEMSQFGNRVVATSDWKLMKNVFNDRSRFPQAKYVRDALSYRSGPTMFTSEGEAWVKRKETLKSLINPNFLKNSIHEISSTSKKLVGLLKCEINDDSGGGGIPIDLAPFIRKSVFDIVGRVIFGTEMRSLENSASELVEIFPPLARGLFGRCIIPLKALWDLPLPFWNRELLATKKLEHFFEQTILDHQKHDGGDNATDLVHHLLSSLNSPGISFWCAPV
eukprot:TRINITY_DN10900_c0_g1_i2.p1 TRINITY_DN10900_c0_g1~~TRINITY_DN10900_c0_g1_i2.p1  ORF type:complete len:319 (+),score=56.77 TRINITY_DN10900_c0_g1_i2:315-1271(+)